MCVIIVTTYNLNSVVKGKDTIIMVIMVKKTIIMRLPKRLT